MENQQLMNDIRQHIVGTWVHDGNSHDELKDTQADDLVLKDALTFKDSEHDILTFTADGKSGQEREIRDPYAPDVKIEYNGEWSLTGIHSTTDEYIWPPYGISTDYHVLTKQYIRIYFSDDFNIMYLCDEANRSCIMKYNRR